MAKNKKSAEDYSGDAPITLDGHPFYGLDISDPEQLVFRNALWNPQNRFVAVEAVAGSGKSTLAVAVACLLARYGRMDEVVYMRVPTSMSEGRLGFLPGSLSEKVRSYMQPLYNTLIKIGENPFAVINDGTMENQKNGTGFITPMTDVYVRGDDWERKVIIIDEAQNATLEQLKTIITRAQDSCLVVLLGSMRQVDLKHKEDSGLVRCMEHFKEKPWAQICTLSKNFRGEMSAWADLM